MASSAKPSATTVIAPEDAADAAVFRHYLATMIAGGQHATMTIGPRIEARVMLEHNTGNRPVTPATIRRYVTDMKAGRWVISGEPIIFSQEGILNDGQHRLLACIEAGVAFVTDVRFGIDRAAFAVTNSHNKRRPGDVLSILGEKNTKALASALNWINRYERGLPGSLSVSITNSDIDAHLDRHPRVRRSCEVGSRLNSATRFLSPSIASALHYIFAGRDETAADAFFEFLIDGIGASRRTDPKVVLRKKLTENLGATAKLSNVYLMAVTIKAWNAVRAGKDIEKVYWIIGNGKTSQQEAFPEAI